MNPSDSTPTPSNEPNTPPAPEATATPEMAAETLPPQLAETSPVENAGETPPPLPVEQPAASVVEGPAAAAPEPPRAPAIPALPPQPVPMVPPAPQPHDLSRIAQDLQIRKTQVEAVVQLLDEENTVPFITRYRKERTGGLNEEFIGRIQERVQGLRELASRKQTILKSIANQGRLNDGLTQAILAAESPKRLEDLYLPFKPKKKSLATEAREKGLGPVAEAIWNGDPTVANLAEVIPGLVDPDKWLLNTDDVMVGIRNILAEMVSDSADVRGPLRAFTWDTGLIVAVRIETLPEGKGREYEPYFNFRELVKEIPPHRVLAINRGEKANVLRVRVDTDVELANEIARYHLNIGEHPHRDLLADVVRESLDRLVLPGLEREVRRELTERAQDHAVLVFAKNLRSLLLQPPLRGKKVLAADPGIRTGCKLAALDETGKLLEEAVVYPHGQKKNHADAKRKFEQLVRKHQINVIAIGNGTGCRETEQLVADLISDLENRRLNPPPLVPETTTESSMQPMPPASQETPTVAGESVASHVPPIAESIVSTHAEMPSSTGSITSEVAIAESAVETTGVPVTTGEPVVASASADAASVSTDSSGSTTPNSPTDSTPNPVVVPPVPVETPISLEGLPEALSELAYVIVIEAGASDYSASPIAREEFPDLDATTRGTISIGRRLQDPLAELVKIDPQHIGVGLYQHDVKQKHLKESLEGVIGSSVNTVGVDLNTASVPLLRHVSGLNQLVARELVNFRERSGRFQNRAQLLQIPGLGEKRFTQAAGFLKITDGEDPLDTTWIHPESYPIATQILADLGFAPADLRDRAKLEELRGKLNGVNAAELAAKVNAGEPTVHDILEALARPGRDPREDLPPPIFKKGVLKLEDISSGMELRGTVLNVVPFGAFVDIGLKESGLVHISQMANRYIKSPYDVVAVGDVITVWVMEVKPGEKKISLSMIPPGQERVRGPGGPGGRMTGDQPVRGERDGNRDRDRDRGRGPGGPPQQTAPGGDRPMMQPSGEQRQGGFQPRGGGERPGGGYQRVGQKPGVQRFGRGAGGPQRPGGGAPQQGQHSGGGNPPTEGAGPQSTSQQPTPPVKRPAGKPKPLPNLSADKKTGKAALNTFAELAAFFKKEEPKPETPPAEPKSETPPDVSESTGEQPPQS